MCHSVGLLVWLPCIVVCFWELHMVHGPGRPVAREVLFATGRPPPPPMRRDILPYTSTASSVRIPQEKAT